MSPWAASLVLLQVHVDLGVMAESKRDATRVRQSTLVASVQKVWQLGQMPSRSCQTEYGVLEPCPTASLSLYNHPNP